MLAGEAAPADDEELPTRIRSSQAVQPAKDAGDPLIGIVLAERYRVVSKLGEGGMGSVYLVEHTAINKKLAIKVLSPEYAHKQDLVDRFLQEARAASMIDQENVVEITDFGATPTGSVFFAMEFLQGEDLAQTVKTQGALPWSRAQVMMLQICEALAAAHDAGIIHRDMKPENCFRIRRGRREDFIKVLDFGIAKVSTEEGEGKLTRTGMIFGTPEYMAPEQARGERGDHRVDIYAAGVILFELLTGRVPFSADTFMGVLTKHMFEAPPAPTSIVPTVPVEVEAIILKALQKDRTLRFGSMREMGTAIAAVGSGAAAVSFVSESVMGPSTGPLHYQTAQGGRPTGVPGTSTFGGAADKRSMRMVWAVLGGVLGLAAVAAVVAVLALPSADNGSVLATDPAPTQALLPPIVAAVDESPSAAAAVADASGGAPAVAEEPPTHASVHITLRAPGVQGMVLDKHNEDTILGRLNESFELPYSTSVRDLLVRADGYEDTWVQVVPEADKQPQVTLPRLQRAPAPSARRRSTGTRDTTPARPPAPPKALPAPKESTTSGTKPPTSRPPKSSPATPGRPDLKDPFG